MKENLHFVNLEYGNFVAYGCKTHFHFVANKMDGYLQFSTNSTGKTILLFNF